ncbi:MAG: hypothetical protein U0794_17635 [Isosphaeraceae bacterium]
MTKRLVRAGLFVFLATAMAAPARAQWGGWGGAGSTVQGSMAAGRGVYAAGAGQYNVQTAQARAINANTAMQWNNYMYAVNQQNAANELKRLQGQQQATIDTMNATYKRLHDNPDAHDIHSGDALNVVLDELVNPKVYTQITTKSTVAIDTGLVKNINLQYAANMILISLQDISSRAVPNDLATRPEFEADRQAIRAIVAQGRQEAQSGNPIPRATLEKFRTAVKAAQAKADAMFPEGTPSRDESDNFLKALYGLGAMLEQPNIAQFLKGLDEYPQTTLGHLISFMHTFNLRFGSAKTPIQEAAYDQIYPLLVQLRDQSQAAGQGMSPVSAAQAPLPDPRGAMSMFSGVPLNQFRQGRGAAAPPQPQIPR